MRHRLADGAVDGAAAENEKVDGMRLTRAVTHIRLCDADHAKIAALDALAAEYQRVCQAYTTRFCTDAPPNPYAAPCVDSVLSQRWQRVAIQQAAGIARSWRANYANADRKSTRLNSSHMSISYAVFCLKKKKQINYC